MPDDQPTTDDTAVEAAFPGFAEPNGFGKDLDGINGVEKGNRDRRLPQPDFGEKFPFSNLRR